MSRRLAELVLAAPRRLIAGFLIVTVLLGLGAVKIRIQDDLTHVVPKSSPVKQAALKLEETFGAAETVVLMVAPPGGDIFTAPFLSELTELNQRLADARPVARVQSLATMNRYVRDANGALSAEPVLAAAPVPASAVTGVRDFVVGDPDIRQAFVGPASAATVLYVDPKGTASDDDVLAALAEALKPLPADYRIHKTGMAVVRDATSRAIRSDMMILIPVVVLVLALILGWTFRSAAGVGLTVAVIALSILPGAGLMGLLGVPMTAVNNTFPVLILAIACADAIHILSTYYGKLKVGIVQREAVREVIEELNLPIFLTSATTAAGFLSLLTSPIPPIGTLGWTVAAGVVWAWLLSIFVLPAALLLAPAPARYRAEGGSTWIHALLERLANIPLNHRAPLAVILFGSLGVLAGLGIPQLDRETRVERFFFADEPARVDAEAIDAAFQGSTPLEVLVHHDVKDPAVLSKAIDFTTAVQKLPRVGSADSIATVIARMQEGFTGKRGIPDDRSQVAQSMLLYSISVPPARFQRFVATDEATFRITVRMPNLHPDELEATLAEIRALAREHLAGVDVSMTGKALFLSELNTMVVRSAVRSVVFSLGLVFLICWLTFRSFREGVEGMTPLFVAVVGVFGIMGIVGIPLTVASALVSAIVIGVGVDFGVHVLARWDLLKGMPLAEHVRETLVEVGYPILLNALAVGCGLGVLALSRFQPIRQLGLLSVAAMLGAAVGAILIIPLMKTLGRDKGGRT